MTVDLQPQKGISPATADPSVRPNRISTAMVISTRLWPSRDKIDEKIAT